jgi:hypothetical protein
MKTRHYTDDPWREASVSSDFHPKESTSRQPIYVLESGFHCSDLNVNHHSPPDIKEVQAIAVETFTQWISEFVPGEHGRKKRSFQDEGMPPVEAKDGLPSVDSNLPAVIWKR